MVDRITNLAANSQFLGYMQKTQQRMLDYGTQLSNNNYLSQDYMGISKRTQYLLSLETSYDNYQAFKLNNTTMTLRLDTLSQAMTSMETTINNFKKELKKFVNETGKTADLTKNLQTFAFNSLKSLEADLNISVGGRSLLGGGRTDTSPVTLNLGSLTDFQTKYNGATVTYPTTRDAHIEHFDLSRDSNNHTNWLEFRRDADNDGTTKSNGSITAYDAAMFSNVTVGSTIEVSGTTNNNGYYTVKSITNGGKTIEVETRMLTDEANNAAGKITLADGTELSAALGDFTDLSFTRTDDKITAAGGTTPLASLAVGTKFTVSGTAKNNGTYTVASVDDPGGTWVKIERKALTDEGTTLSGDTTETRIQSPTVVGALAFTDNAPSSDTIVSTAAVFTNVKAGMKVTFASTTSNNTSFTVKEVSSDYKTITVVENVTAEAASPVGTTLEIPGAVGTVKSLDYYNGDELTQTHRLDETRKFDFNTNALDPAFEKAIRAMAIVAQGVYGTEGGLDQNLTRATDAIHLIESAYNGSTTVSAPYGTERTGNIQALSVTISYHSVMISQATKSHDKYISFLDKQITGIEQGDPMTIASNMLSEETALKASYEILARIKDLNMTNFL
ncbi:MAG: hypothetical protein HQL36_02350 [Alphaproteobacteria bacterium]|nr:hypothetical protein [Alphaproteobacteria bacterium]MBF0249296.1 hypothetical protein [Alphaproteobacteria bacterium]